MYMYIHVYTCTYVYVYMYMYVVAINGPTHMYYYTAALWALVQPDQHSALLVLCTCIHTV